PRCPAVRRIRHRAPRSSPAPSAAARASTVSWPRTASTPLASPAPGKPPCCRWSSAPSRASTAHWWWPAPPGVARQSACMSARALVVVGADRRGTAFGLYELSRRIGVSPWTWWADVPPPRRQQLYVAPGRFTDAPKVRYRGIFINDEEPALGGWTRATFGGTN